MNKVLLIGRITKDLELRHTSNDKAVCDFTLAVNRDKQKIQNLYLCKQYRIFK